MLSDHDGSAAGGGVPTALPEDLQERLRVAQLIDGDRFPSNGLRVLEQLGVLQWPLGAEQGRRGYLQLLELLHTIGTVSLPLGRVFEGHVNALQLVQRFGSHDQARRVEQRVHRDHLLFGVWNTGPRESPRLLPRGGGRYQLEGSKTFATGAGRIDVSIVTASLPDGGWQMCLAPASGEGVRVNYDTWSPLGMEATESYTVEFSLLLDEDALVGQPGDYYAEPTFSAGAFRFSAVQLGAAQALVDATANFMLHSEREGDALQLQRLGEMVTLAQSGMHWLKQSSEWLGAGGETEAECVRTQAQMMRIATEDICSRITQLVQVCAGARGLASAEPFARRLRDLQMYLRQGGYDAAFQRVGRYAVEQRRAHV